MFRSHVILAFIIGFQANILNWTASPTDVNSGTGMYGTCCNEMDIWEGKLTVLAVPTFLTVPPGNMFGEAYTPHSCSVVGQTQCSGTACGEGSERYDGTKEFCPRQKMIADKRRQASATRTAAISTPGAWAIRLSSGPA
jgi:hypothetical protein